MEATATKPKEKFNPYSHGEGVTGGGQVVEFSCVPDTQEMIREFLKEHVKYIHTPTTGQVNIVHGGYGKYTRYKITQHKYAGGGYGPGNGGYIEVLEIADAPDGRYGIVIHEDNSSHGCHFTEWETLQNALDAFEEYWSSGETEKKFSTLPGFKRRVACGALTPWFYAIGDEILLGDTAFPEGLQDDPVFRFGKQFLVFDRFDKDILPVIKTCMGTRAVHTRESEWPFKEFKYRIVYWDDGDKWVEGDHYTQNPRPLEEGEEWITDALLQFRMLLAGKKTEFSVNFMDGGKFVGKLVAPKDKRPSPEGRYLLSVKLKGARELKKGWVDFKPTSKVPNILEYVKRRFAEGGQEVEKVEKVEIKEKRVENGGQKWSGVFHHSPLH